jgi:hypothetical protein
LCENPGKVPTKRKKGIKIHTEQCMHSLSSEEFANSKAFGVKWLRTFNSIL